MTGNSSSSAIAAYYGAKSEQVTDSAVAQAQHFVGQHRKPLSDEEREAHIKACGVLMEDAMRRWCETGCFSHRGEADRWKLLMEEAIRSRPPEYVAKLERERGLT
jgi:hypothetical protein